MTKKQETSFSRKLEQVLSEIHENALATREIHKEIDRLKRSNDRSFARAKRAVESLAG